MKMKALITAIAMMLACSLSAQNYNLDEQEDTTDITTLADIIAIQTEVTTQRGSAAHYQKVWGRKKYFNLNYSSSSKMAAGAGDIKGTSQKLDLEKDLSVGLQLGKTINFHKKAIGGIAMIGLNYTYIDLNFNQYKEQDAPKDWVKGVYMEPYYYQKGDTEYANLPFFNKTSELDYGMDLGPTLTLFPFTPLHNKYTDEIRLQVYLQWGYHVMGMLIDKVPNAEDVTVTEDTRTNTQIAWGHGMSTTFGFNIGWKGIGIGYETRKATFDNIVPISKEFDTGNKSKFKQTLGRVYLQIKY